METALIPRTHLPSHWLSCGHTRPQTAGSALDSPIILYALSKFPLYLCNECRNVDINRASCDTFAFYSPGSAVLLLLLRLCCIQDYLVRFVARTFGSCSRTGTLFNPLPLFVLRTGRIHRDGCAFGILRGSSSLCHIHLLTFHSQVEVYQMTVKLRSVYAGKFTSLPTIRRQAPHIPFRLP